MIPLNEGARQLAEMPVRQVARDLGVAPSTVSRWAAGSIPDPAHQSALAERYGIPESTWHQSPQDSGAPAESEPARQDVSEVQELVPTSGSVNAILASLGQRLLSELGDRPGVVAERVQAPKSSVSNWRNGTCKPDAEARRRIAAAYPEITEASWDTPVPFKEPAPKKPKPEPAAKKPRPEPAPKKPNPQGSSKKGAGKDRASPPADRSPPPPPPLPSEAEVELMGLDAVDAVIGDLSGYRAELPAAQAWRVAEVEGRLRLRREQLARADQDARLEYLGSDEFRADVLAFAKLAGADVYQAIARASGEAWGVTLPEIPTEVPKLDLEALKTGLEAVRDLGRIGESDLAMAESIKLRVAERAGVIAKWLHDTPSKAGEILGLLDDDDRAKVQRALDLRFAITDLRKLSKATRATVAKLLSLVGQARLAREVISAAQ